MTRKERNGKGNTCKISTLSSSVSNRSLFNKLILINVYKMNESRTHEIKNNTKCKIRLIDMI